MRITLSLSGVRHVTAGDLAWRFVLGGTVTAATALVARAYGPGIGGVFLAFPAILPASLTLVAKGQERRKAALGLSGTIRGRKAAALDALGAFLGSAGLLGFAVAMQRLAIQVRPAFALAGATLVWFAIAWFLWALRHAHVMKSGKEPPITGRTARR